jgi:hypothetical protein
MEGTIEVTQTGQDEPQVGFDENGELKFTEKGLESFQELLKEGTPEAEKTEEEVEETEKKPEPEPEKEKEPEPPKEEKYKIKIDGQEEEVTKEQLLELAQKGKDYTRKTQQLSEERNALAPYEALIQQLKQDPKLSQHIAEYWQKPTQKAEAKQFDDPIEQLKWEIRQEVIAETKKEIQGAITPLAQTMTLNQVRQQVMADPDYQEIHGKIIDYVKSQPPSIGRTLHLQLDQDPNAYLELFSQLKSAKVSQPKTEIAKPEPRSTTGIVKFCTDRGRSD